MAQWLEHRSYKAGVDGSIPSRRTGSKKLGKKMLPKYLLLAALLLVLEHGRLSGLVAQLVRALR